MLPTKVSKIQYKLIFRFLYLKIFIHNFTQMIFINKIKHDFTANQHQESLLKKGIDVGL